MEFVTQNIFWIVLAVVSGGMWLAPMLRAGGGRFGVSPSEAVMLINREDAIVVDVRSAEDFEKGHLPNARNIPVADIEKRVGEINRYKSKPVIVVCESGIRGDKAAAELRKLAFERVLNLTGGIAAWTQATQPLVKGRK